jgi:hypothetical protein
MGSESESARSSRVLAAHRDVFLTAIPTWRLGDEFLAGNELRSFGSSRSTSTARPSTSTAC